MRKSFIILVVILCSFLVVSYVVNPKVKYSKIIEMLDINYEDQTLESSNNKIETEQVISVQLLLDYESYGAIGKNNEYSKSNTRQENKEKFRSEAKNYHHGNNTKIIKDMNFGNYQELYVSKYSPFIDITYNYDYFISHKTELLAKLTENKYVKEARVENEIVYQENMIFAMRGSDAEEVYTTRSKTGDGVVVGILESGIVRQSDPLLADVDFTLRPSAYNFLGITDHATAMAQLIAGSTGVAPGVSILTAFLFGTLNDEMDWMLDKGADIINMSFGQVGTEGTYASDSAYCDYIAYTYDVILVAAAGNRGEGDGYVGNPGLGYNVITVGSADYSGTLHDFSSYITLAGPIKPTICVDGAGITISEDLDTVSGTSVSSALCSGLIALLLEDYPELITQKEKLISLIMANASSSRFYDYDNQNGFDRVVGAGLFSYQNIIDHYYTAFRYTNSNGTEDTIFKQRMMHFDAGEVLRVAFFHLAKATGSTSGTVFTDYDLYIKDAQGNIVHQIVDGQCNAMLGVYTIPQTGYYQIEIFQYSEKMDAADYTSLAYAVY